MIIVNDSRSGKKEEPEMPVLQETDADYCNQKELNIQRLVKSGILTNYVKENNGTWDHQRWLSLCKVIFEKGYFPIDLDQVGLALAQEKKHLLEGKNKDQIPAQ